MAVRAPEQLTGGFSPRRGRSRLRDPEGLSRPASRPVAARRGARCGRGLLLLFPILSLLVDLVELLDPSLQPGRETQRSIRVAVEAGYTYTVNFDMDNTSYFVVRSE